MIRIAFFDVGETLIHDYQPFPGVQDALAVVAHFETAIGDPLCLGVISDYFMPEPPPSEAKIAALEEQYRAQVLQPNGLAAFFQPFESRVTLSSRAGVFKPERQIFESALIRSATGASLADCLFVTENLDHLSKCAEYGMTPVRFGTPAADIVAFQKWEDAPAVIAALLARPGASNLPAANRPVLSSRFGLYEFVPKQLNAEMIHGMANQLMQLNDDRLGPLNGVYVERPTDVNVALGADGEVAHAEGLTADPEEVEDAVNFVISLLKSGRVAIPGQPSPAFGVTHVVERDSADRMRLARRRYSSR